MVIVNPPLWADYTLTLDDFDYSYEPEDGYHQDTQEIGRVVQWF